MYGTLTSTTYHIIMIATGNSRNMVEQLITSIDQNVQSVKILLVLVFQGKKEKVPQPKNFNLHWENAGEQMSLSRARNRGLAVIEKYHYLGHHLMFPDDDSVFTQAFFNQFQRVVTPGEAYLCRMLNLENGEDYKKFPAANMQDQNTALIPYVASAGLIIPQQVVKEVGSFDERLGVGAIWGSSEDVDYYLRCTKHTGFHFVRELFTLHPGRFEKYSAMDKEAIWKRFKSYSDGYYFVMCKYGLVHRLRWLPLRALGGAVLSLLRAQGSLSFIYLRLCIYRLTLQKKLKWYNRYQPQLFEEVNES